MKMLKVSFITAWLFMASGLLAPLLAQDADVANASLLSGSLWGQEIVWISGNADYSAALAWGDVDGDGDLDLAVGNGEKQGAANHLYLNDDGRLQSQAAWQSKDASGTNALAWGDIDADGDLDLIAANWDAPVNVYLNENGALNAAAGWNTERAERTRSIALGDFDGDGDYDLAVGNNEAPNRIYRNLGTRLDPIPAWSSAEQDATEAIAWADMDNDGDLDLAVGNFNEPNRIYLNRDGVLQDEPIWTSSETDATRALAWLDVDNDGDLDLAVANEGSANRVYFNDNGLLADAAQWNSLDVGRSQDMAAADVDSDGDLDLVVVDRGSGLVYYQNMDGELAAAPIVVSQRPDDSVAVALGDVDGDGDLDLAVGDESQPVRLLRHVVYGLSRTPAVPLPGSDAAKSAVWGDIDRDGDIDLVIGEADGSCLVFRNDTGRLTPEYARLTEDDTAIEDLALGDVDGDGWLDLAIGRRGRPTQVHANRNGQFDHNAEWQSEEIGATRSVSWIDVDGDHDLDLLVGNEGARNRLYLNEGTKLTPFATWSSPNDGRTFSVDWGDFDNDGDLDLAVGNDEQAIEVFLNEGGLLSAQPVWQSAERDRTRAVAWGDVDSDGDLDLAVANEGQPNRLYENHNGTLLATAGWLSLDADHSESLVWHDVDNDGDLDLTVGNSGEPDKIYFNDRGALQMEADWMTADRGATRIVRWADINQDGRPDLLRAGLDFSTAIHVSQLPGLPPYGRQPTIPYLYGDGLSVAALAPTNGIALATVQEEQSLPFKVGLSPSSTGGFAGLRAWYSLNGGGAWLPAELTMMASSTSSATFTWDLFASQFFGASDRTALRLELSPHYFPVPGQAPATQLYPPASTATYPFRARGTQIRVVNESGAPVSGASVYRIPFGAAMAVQPESSAVAPARTDAQGFLSGYGAVGIGDQLLALAPKRAGDGFVLHYTNGKPTETGLAGATVTAAGVQTLVVRPEYPLLLFDLVVSLEWDATSDAEFLARLTQDLYKASAALYDWTNGQVAPARVSVYHGRENWQEADIKIYASNQLRPYANRGGIVAERTSIDLGAGLDPLIAQPGEIRIGTRWDRYGGSRDSSDDWAHVLAHELAHYLLFLEDTYLGFDEDTQTLVSVTTCNGTAMSDPYDTENSEFRYRDDKWEEDCGASLAELPDWELIRAVFPELQTPPPGNSGPTAMPFRFTDVRFAPSAIATLQIPSVELAGLDDAFRYARAYLIDQGSQIIDLGAPRSNVVKTHGATIGDELCLFAETSSACTMLTGEPPERFVISEIWEPEIALTQPNTTTLAILVDAPNTERLTVTLYPAEGNPLELDLQPGVQRQIELSTPSVEATLDIQGDHAGQRQVIAYATGGGPGRARSHDGPGRARSHDGPVATGNGRVVLYPPENWPTNRFITLRLAGKVSPPPGLAPVERAYYVSASDGAQTFDGGSILFHFDLETLEDSGVSEPENYLYVHYWNGEAWLRLATTVNLETMTASAPLQGMGLYSLMLSDLRSFPVAGWNVFGYSLRYPQPIAPALEPIAGLFTIIYEQDSSQENDRWRVYAPDAPDHVNTLSHLRPSLVYHIFTTAPLVLPLRPLSAAEEEPPCMQNCPPALYYGEVIGFTPGPAEPTVEAFVGEVECGRGAITEFEGKQVYSVLITSAAEKAGCGTSGSAITIGLSGRTVSVASVWNNERANLVNIVVDDSALTRRSYLPAIRHQAQ